MLSYRNGHGGGQMGWQWPRVDGASGAGLGALGADAYRDSRIACNSTICYGIDGGYTHKWLMDCQVELNRLGKYMFGTWTAIKEDGFVGSATFKAALKIFPMIPKIVQLGRCCPSTYIELSRWLAWEHAIYDALYEFGREPGEVGPPVQAYAPSTTSKQPGTTTTVSKTPTSPATSTGTRQAVMTTPASSTEKKPGMTRGGIALVVLGGLAVVGLVGAGIYWQRRKAA